jgi:hypothetical protein
MTEVIRAACAQCLSTDDVYLLIVKFDLLTGVTRISMCHSCACDFAFRDGPDEYYRCTDCSHAVHVSEARRSGMCFLCDDCYALDSASWRNNWVKDGF